MALAAAILGGGLVATALAAAPSRHAVRYLWRNVTVGGGGFAPAVVFSPAERGLAYLRTDMGGAYRWSALRHEWIPLEDGIAQSSYFGIESLAADPVDPDIVYLAAGMYPNQPAAILRSDDRGNTWHVFPTPFRMGGNMPGRGVGERLAIDPHDRSILYFGTRYDGLQRSLDRGRTWRRMDTFPWRGTGWRNAPRMQTGISFVVIDPEGGRAALPSRRIYVGLTLSGARHLIYSKDAGRSWHAVPGQPPADLLPVQAGLDAHGVLYVTYSNGTGPNGITDGAVYRYDTRTGRWTNITPGGADGSRASGGYMGLAVDAGRPGTLLVASVDRWHPGDILWRSTHGGRTWRNLRAHSRRDVSASPFLLWGHAQADFGWWIAGVAIDPFDPEHAAYTTGATVYATRDLLSRAPGRPLLWKPWVRGVEQTAVLTLVSPPKGPHLLSGFGDLSGFVHESLRRSPTEQFTHPVFANTDTIDFASLSPNIVVRGGTRAPRSAPGAPTLAYSLDYGRSWEPLQPPSPASAIVVSADGRKFIALSHVPEVTANRGRTWHRVQGLVPGAHPIADRVAPETFYSLDFKHARLYVSRDGGRTFRARTTRGLPPDLELDRPRSAERQWPLIAAPGRRGDLWLVSHQGLFHSENGGHTFARVGGRVRVIALGFGKAAPAHRYPTLFALGRRAGQLAIWRSEDLGRAWLRINDSRHVYGQRLRCIAGDPRVFGRVYVGTDGRGIVYGEPAAR